MLTCLRLRNGFRRSHPEIGCADHSLGIAFISR